MGIITSLLFVLFLLSSLHSPTSAIKKSYVVYMGRSSQMSKPSTTDVNTMTESYYELLGSCIKSKDKAKEAIFYSYTSYINGFAANLEDEEVDEVSKRSEVVSVFPNEVNELHTTRSWEFLGLEGSNGKIPADSLWLKARFGEDVIIGNLDTGVWPESESFNDEGMGPIPSRWKGFCDSNDGVKCNRKLIGARHFNKGYEAALGRPLNASFNTARDTDGHGTHTLSTAGGSFVSGANLLGSANGTAKGGSPGARVASYKVCWPSCYDADILAAFDAAIQDGVDILSVSLGSRAHRPYFSHGISIGSFHAVKNGILVVCSAGNSGPAIGTVANVAPWILTVGASTIDRDFTSDVFLGNYKSFKGRSFNTNTLPAKKYHRLIYSVDAKAANASARDSQDCSPGSLDATKVKGKIVLCFSGTGGDMIEPGFVVAQAGGIGMVLASSFPGSTINPGRHFIPTSLVSAADGLSILLYIQSTKSPVAYISGGTEVGEVAAPIMASFSSVGPNEITPEILKPDITAPGSFILAAYTEARASSLPEDKRKFPFNIVSGTSMSCPHVSGIAGLLKTVHPHWSPAAIKSAIMTTARTRSNVRQPIATSSLVEASPFNYGAGHVWPNRAADPGLVYDLTTTDYLNFLCSIGYNSTQISIFSEDPYECPSKNASLLAFNYPSIAVPNLSGKVTLTRTLKNVGAPGVYRARIKAPDGISVKIEPMSLEFTKVNEEKNFKVTLDHARGNGSLSRTGSYAFGGLTWSDGWHHVRSPIVVRKTRRGT